jgi:hypothetical protein
MWRANVEPAPPPTSNGFVLLTVLGREPVLLSIETFRQHEFLMLVHDRTIFHTEGLADKIPFGKKAVADRGYTGEECKQKLGIRNPPDSDE